MDDLARRLRGFFLELKRRNVYRVAITYAVVTFVVVQLAELAAGAFALPGWFERMVWVLCGLGFPLAMVLAWAFDVTPEGVRRTGEAADRPEEESAREAFPGAPGDTETPDAAGPSERERPARKGQSGPTEHFDADPERFGSQLALQVLVGLGLLAAAVAGGWYLTGSGGGSPKITERTVAVLPFEVSGSGAEDWRDGMVSLLSTGLDGAGGLRAVADRTVFAAWRRSGRAEESASTEEALSVAREIGAEYAVVGSAAALGSELQLAAQVHATQAGERIGQAEVHGHPDSVTALAHELTRRVIAVLARETGEPLGSADLAAVTTRSVPALKAFLDGERHLRAGEQFPAIDDFEAAIRADSAFALPYARIGLLSMWKEGVPPGYLQRARELAGQLPERERRHVRALHLGGVERRSVAAADSLRRLTRDYPEDPVIWQSLGEFVFHAYIPRGVPEVERAHERAVTLDPGNTSYWDHYVMPAFNFHHDSALAAERIAAMPDGGWKRMYALSHDLVFGGPEARERALAAYDTAPIPEPHLATDLLGPVHDGELEEQVLLRLLQREGRTRERAVNSLPGNALARGRVEQGLAYARRQGPTGMACYLARAAAVGVPVPDSLAARYLEPESLPDAAPPQRLVCGGFYLVDQRRGGELAPLLDRLRASLSASAGEGAPRGEVQAWMQATVAELEGYRAFRRGELERAAELAGGNNMMGSDGALWRGDLFRRMGQRERAEGWYLAAWQLPVTHERLGRLYEDMGRNDEAAAAYRRFVDAWEEADPELQPRVERARERLEALTRDDGGPDG